MLFWQYGVGEWDTYIGALFLLGGLLALWFAYRFLLAFFGKKEIKEQDDSFPRLLSLENPLVRGEVRFLFELPVPCNVSFYIETLKGDRIMTICEGAHQSGNHPYTFNTKEIPNGVYYYVFNAEKYRTSRKMIVDNRA